MPTITARRKPWPEQAMIGRRYGKEGATVVVGGAGSGQCIMQMMHEMPKMSLVNRNDHEWIRR